MTVCACASPISGPASSNAGTIRKAANMGIFNPFIERLRFYGCLLRGVGGALEHLSATKLYLETRGVIGMML